MDPPKQGLQEGECLTMPEDRTPVSIPSTAREAIASKNTTIAECGTHDDVLVLQSLKTMKDWAEDKEHCCFHLVVISGKVDPSWVDSVWLKAAEYKFSQGSGRSNISQWHKSYSFPGITINHLIHPNGTWSIQITPRVPQSDPTMMINYADRILVNAFGSHYSMHVVVRRFEASRPDSDHVLAWLKENNIREIKAYVHDNYEARMEVTYLDPVFGPKVSRILAELG